MLQCCSQTCKWCLAIIRYIGILNKLSAPDICMLFNKILTIYKYKQRNGFRRQVCLQAPSLNIVEHGQTPLTCLQCWLLLVTAQEVSKWWMKLQVCNYPRPAPAPAYHFRTIVPHFSHRNNDNWSDITHTDQRQTPVVRKICSELVNGCITSAFSAHG